MATGKTFQTTFSIGTKWTGQEGIAQAQRSLGGLQKTAQRATVHVKGMARSAFAAIASYDLLSKAVGGSVRVLEKSFAAATEAQEAHDELGLSIERVSKRYKNTMGKSAVEVTRIVEESTQALIAASEVMEQTGHDAETLQKGFAKLAATGALDPKQILEQRDAFSDVLSYIAGANATAEESAHLGEQWADAILRGNVALLKQMDLSTGEIALVQKITKLEKEGSISGEEAIKRRQDLVLKFARKFEGETLRVFERPSGKIQRMWIEIGNVFETLGKPFIDRAPELATAFGDMAKSIKPAADELARITAEGLKGITSWFEAHKAEIPLWIKNIEDALKRVYDLLMLFDKIPVLIDLPKLLKQAQELMDKWKPGQIIQPQVPKAMDWRYPEQAQPAPTSTEEANRQLEEARKKAEGARSSQYPPYQRESQALQTAKRAEAVGSISGNLMARVKEMEGYYAKAYWDYKQWSIGHGTKASGPGETITREGAEKALAAELAVHQANVDRAAASVGLKLTPGQRDALTSFDFNTGDAAKPEAPVTAYFVKAERKVSLPDRRQPTPHRERSRFRAMRVSLRHWGSAY